MPELDRSPRSFKQSVRASFDRQAFMATIGARLSIVEPGRVVIDLPYRPDICGQQGILHAGVLAGLLDMACEAATMTLLPPGSGVLAVEFKVSLLAPPRGNRFLARGRIIRAGNTLTTCSADVFATGGRSPTLVATMLATMMNRPVSGRVVSGMMRG